MDDLISRQMTIEHLQKRLYETALNNVGVQALCDSIFADTADNRIPVWVNEIASLGQTAPSVGPEIIRCKDCKRWKDPRDYECPYHTSGDPFIDDPEETFYCGKEEREEE